MTTQRTRSRRSIGALLVVGLCALACALPIVGGIAAGTVVDRFLDSPPWLGLLVAAAAVVTIMVMLGRGKRRPGGC